MHTKIATAIVLSLAFASQQRGWVSSVTSTADANPGTVQVTVRGNNPCGAVNLDFGDGTSAVTHAISQLPVTMPHEYNRTGEFLSTHLLEVESCAAFFCRSASCWVC